MNIRGLICLVLLGTFPSGAISQGFGTVIDYGRDTVHVASQTGGNFGIVHNGYRPPSNLYYYYPAIPRNYYYGSCAYSQAQQFQYYQYQPYGW